MALNFDDLLNAFVILWAAIDPIGTVPVFIAVTKGFKEDERKKIATVASIVAFFILLFFFAFGDVLLKRVGVPLAAFQISGGIILFLVALNMFLGDSKPEEEMQLLKSGQETAIFPLAIPSIASPGAILAMVLLANRSHESVKVQGITVLIMFIILIINLFFMRFSGFIHKKIGNSGAIIISKVMGLILASIAANNVLLGIKEYFKIL